MNSIETSNNSIQDTSPAPSPRSKARGGPKLTEPSSLKARFDAWPGVLKMALFAGGGVVALMLLGALFSILTTLLAPSEDVKTRELPPNILQPPSTSSDAEQNGLKAQPDEATATRESLWKDVRIQHRNLVIELAELNEDLRLARAQRWLLHAQAECSQKPDCESAYTWLIGKYGEYKSKIEATLVVQVDSDAGDTRLAQKMLTDAKTVGAYRQNMATLMDVATALTLTNAGAVPSTFVATTSVDRALDRLGQATANFEGLRLQQSQATYAGEASLPPANQTDAPAPTQINDPPAPTPDP
ncbi:MAG: hypothetical protein F6K19_33860 [Cyanothece sp. SIO1E1]|nr:hypothetical protein [Cyanothece sp. SIO1E1]